MSKELSIINGFGSLDVSDLEDDCVELEVDGNYDNTVNIYLNKQELKQLKEHIDYLLSK